MSAASVEEIVTSQAVIQDCLNEISANNTPLSLTIKGSEESPTYSSRIQSFNPKKKQIVLKQVLPSDWRERITPTCKLEIKSYMNMGNIRFHGLMSTLDESEDSPYCKLTFPAKIFRLQLRDYYRVSLSKIQTKVSLRMDDDTLLIGHCRDISMSGAMIALSDQNAKLEIGKSIENCQISIEDILELSFAGEIRSIQEDDAEKLIGLQFVDLSPGELKPISAALNKIERLNIKR